MINMHKHSLSLSPPLPPPPLPLSRHYKLECTIQLEILAEN